MVTLCKNENVLRIFQIGKTNCLELGNKESMQTRSEKQTLNCVFFNAKITIKRQKNHCSFPIKHGTEMSDSIPM
jgi:hypothetical protein